MKLSEAIKILDDTIPPPGNKMYDGDRMDIGIAWKVIKTCLCEPAKKLRGLCRYAGECELNFVDGEQCKDFQQGETEPPKPLSCEFCGQKLVWENPHIPGRWHASSCYLGDGWPICIDCMAAHCESANCVKCKYGTYPGCRFYYLHRDYDPTDA